MKLIYLMIFSSVASLYSTEKCIYFTKRRKKCIYPTEESVDALGVVTPATNVGTLWEITHQSQLIFDLTINNINSGKSIVRLDDILSDENDNNELYFTRIEELAPIVEGKKFEFEEKF